MLGAAALDELERNPPSIGRQHTTLLAAMGAAPHAHAHANLQGDISCNSYTSEIETPTTIGAISAPQTPWRMRACLRSGDLPTR